MFYKIKLEKKAIKFLKKLDVNQETKVIGAIDKLAESPFPKNKKHILELSGSSMLCELAVDKLRIYYTIENQFVVIEDVEYEGVVNILDGHNDHKSGNSIYPNQRSYIYRLKHWFSKK